jgi:cell division protease FtsH
MNYNLPKNGKGPGFENRGMRGPTGCGIHPLFIWLLLLPIIAYWMFSFFGRGKELTTISYSKFYEQIKEGNIKEVVVEDEKISGVYKEPVKREIKKDKSVKINNFITYIPSFGDNNLLPLLEDSGVEVYTRPERRFSFWTILFNVLPFILIVWFLLFFFRRMSSQGRSVFSMGKSRAKLYKGHKESTTFDDVAGSRGIKTELREIIDFLKNPTNYRRLGGRVPKGVLLVGPPGCVIFLKLLKIRAQALSLSMSSIQSAGGEEQVWEAGMTSVSKH